jgi:hypothetical protein
VTTYAACFILAKVAQPSLCLPKSSEFLFTTPDLLWRDDIASSYGLLWSPGHQS